MTRRSTQRILKMATKRMKHLNTELKNTLRLKWDAGEITMAKTGKKDNDELDDLAEKLKYGYYGDGGEAAPVGKVRRNLWRQIRWGDV